MSRELLQQALDALLHSDSPSQKRADAIAALREALAAPQPEPVAEVIDREHQPWEHGKHTSWLVNPSDLPAGTKLYAAAPPAAPAPADWGTPHDVSGAPWGAPAPAVCDGGTCGLGGYCTNCPRLSAAPVVREPLTDEQIDALWSSPMSADWEHREFARAIEAHHGIGGGGK